MRRAIDLNSNKEFYFENLKETDLDAALKAKVNQGKIAGIFTVALPTAPIATDKVYDYAGVDNTTIGGIAWRNGDSAYYNGSAWTRIPFQSLANYYLKTDVLEKRNLGIFSRGKNLFDKSTAISGYVVNDGNGTIYANASYYASDYIEIEPSTQYTVNFAYFSAYYDINKVFISGLGNTGAARTHTSPSNAKFIRISLLNAKLNTLQYEAGASVTTYESYYNLIPTTYLAKYPFLLTDITDGSLPFTKTDFIGLGKNLFNYRTVTDGKYVNDATGNLATNAIYAASDYIAVEPSTDYTTTQSTFQAYYDINKVYISGLTAAATQTNPRTFTTPALCKYIRISVLTNSLSIESYMLEQSSVQTAFEVYGNRFTKELPVPRTFTPEINLPSIIYGLAGQELNVYFDNIINDVDSRYEFDIVCSVGKHLQNGWRWSPTAANSYNFKVLVNQYGVNLALKNIFINVKAATVGNGITKSLLIIGDSTTAGGITTQKLLDNFSTDVMDITLIGTKGISPNLHEGISGWTLNKFYTDATSPFVFSGSFNFSQYISTNSLATPDYVIINLGINDTFNYTDDATLQIQINAMLVQYQAIIDNILTFDSDIKIGIALTIPPAYGQESFGKDYASGLTRYRYKRNNFLLVKSLISTFDNRTSENIYLVPIHTNLDTRYNMGLESLVVNARSSKTIENVAANGSVHPSTDGYWQIADVIWYWLKSFES